MSWLRCRQGWRAEWKRRQAMVKRQDAAGRFGKAAGPRKPALYLLAGLLSGGLLMAAGPVGAAAEATPGSLDPSFGTGGKVLTDLGVGGGVASDAVLQSNGDIVVSGGFGVARYLPSGQLDKSFGTGGPAPARLSLAGARGPP